MSRGLIEKLGDLGYTQGDKEKSLSLCRVIQVCTRRRELLEKVIRLLNKLGLSMIATKFKKTKK